MDTLKMRLKNLLGLHLLQSHLRCSSLVQDHSAWKKITSLYNFSLFHRLLVWTKWCNDELFSRDVKKNYLEELLKLIIFMLESCRTFCIIKFNVSFLNDLHLHQAFGCLLTIMLTDSKYVCKSSFKHGKSPVKRRLKTKINYNCLTWLPCRNLIHQLPSWYSV